MIIALLILILAPIPMMVVGSLYLDTCDNHFYSIWLIVDGAIIAYLWLATCVVAKNSDDDETEEGRESAVDPRARGKKTCNESVQACVVCVAGVGVAFLCVWH